MERSEDAGPRGATLLVRHLPDAVPHETLRRLFAHYGASDVRPCVGRLRSCAFVDFPDDASAARAQSYFHRLHFLGKSLTVERARAIDDKQTKSANISTTVSPEKILHSGSTPARSFPVEPIAPSLGVNYPFPPHLHYAYPPPDNNIITNIANALIAVPKFYTQVLHLMNKMNLPAPFQLALPRPPQPKSKHQVDVASDESELESDEDSAEGRTRKRRRQDAILGPAVAKDASHEAAGVKTVIAPSMAVSSIKKKQPILQIKIAPKPEEKKKAQVEAEKVEEETNEQQRLATREELEKGKLPPEMAATHPVLKNYTPGSPSPVLYIKNLEKDVVSEDLFYVFGAFFSSFEVARQDLNIKLMQQGRMKGQAFVSFPSMEMAADALKTAHLFVLKGKPMVIQFGRNK